VNADALKFDALKEADTIAAWVKQIVLGKFRKKGVVVGISGGIDSATVAALCVRALGKEKVFGLLMPERDSSGDSLRLGRAVAGAYGIETQLAELGPALEAIGCYRAQLEAIREVFKEYGEGWKHKITLPSILDGDRLNYYLLTVADPGGKTQTERMPLGAYLKLVAATNFKQRLRKTTEYFHADRLNFAVAGTPNRLEYDQGFFVKLGDGAADLKPIAHLYKTQVFALAEALGVPAEVRARPPTTDTYSLPQSQEEFFFALPYQKMDLCLWAHDHGVPAAECATTVGLTPEQVERVYKDIVSKRRFAEYLHASPELPKAI
jgi:NAD+ synthase